MSLRNFIPLKSFHPLLTVKTGEISKISTAVIKCIFNVKYLTYTIFDLNINRKKKIYISQMEV